MHRYALPFVSALACSSPALDRAAPALAPLPDAETSPVGTVVGGFDVDVDGAATYALPIRVPPSRSGLVPELALVYNSRDGNGLLGMGWSLAGLSEIRRCPSTLATDGVRRAVRGDSRDAWCLDGERLLEYGRNSERVEWRTEMETFRKVVSHEWSASHGAGRFDVHQPDGRLLRYGLSQDGRVADSSGVVHRWLLEEVRDRFGNVLTVQYDHDDGVRPRRVITMAGPAPREVRFSYDSDRIDPVHFNRGRLSETQRHRLIGIEVTIAREPVYVYKLDYEVAPATQRSRLVSISECAGDGVCKPATRFEWQDGNVGWDAPITYGHKIADQYQVDSGFSMDVQPFFEPTVADINGDGLDDVVEFKSWNYLRVLVSRGNGSFAEVHSNPDLPQTEVGLGEAEGCRNPWAGFGGNNPLGHGHYAQHAMRINWNGDRFDDLLVLDPTERWTVLLGSASGELTTLVTDEVRTCPNNRGKGPTFFADLDGDGRADMLKCLVGQDGADDRWTYGLLGDYGWGLEFYGGATGLGANCSESHVSLFDHDGDGAVSAIVSDEHAQNNVAMVTAGSAWFSGGTPAMTFEFEDTGQAMLPTSARPHAADINGDGLADWLIVDHPPFAPWRLVAAFNVGALEAAQSVWLELVGLVTAGGTNGAHDVIVDRNRDGLADLLAYRLHEEHDPLNSQDDIPVYTVYQTRSDASGADETAEWITTWNAFDVDDANNFPSRYFRPVVFDHNGDGIDDLLTARRATGWGSGYWELRLGRGSKPDLLVAVRDGLNGSATTPTVAIEYEPLTEDRRHTPGNCTYPTSCAPEPIHVVSAVTYDTGPASPSNRYAYVYEGARRDLRGRGWLGFSKITIIHNNDGVQERWVTTFDNATFDAERQLYPFARLPRYREHVVAADTNTEIREMTFVDYVHVAASGGLTSLTLPTTRRVWSNEVSLPDESLIELTAAETTVEYDEFANPTRVTTNRAGEFEYVEQAYHNDTAEWILGVPLSRTVTRANAAGSVRRAREWRLDPQTGLITQETVDPGTPYERVTTLTRDAAGNVIISATAADSTVRKRKVTFDSELLLPVLVANEVDHVTEILADRRFGALQSLREPNGVVVEWARDGFGRVAHRSVAGEPRVSILRSPESHGYREDLTDAAGRFVSRRIDRLGRASEVTTTGFAGEAIKQKLTFDRYGRQVRKSRPYVDGATSIAYWTWTRDRAGRVVRARTPAGDETRFEYSGSTRTVIDPVGNRTVAVVDKQGRTVEVTDADGGQTLYRYGPHGSVVELTDPAGNQTTMTYDDRGLRTALVEPSGTRTFEYSGYGELALARDPAGDETIYERDALGRVTRRTNAGGITSFAWDGADNGLGRLASAVSADGHQTAWSYDVLGRASAVTVTVDGVAMSTTVDYNSAGDVERVAYPSADTAPAGDPLREFAVRFHYNRHGHLAELTDDVLGRRLWSALAAAPDGRVVSELLGNGALTTTSVDALGRIESLETAAAGAVVQKLDYSYDAAGNMATRADGVTSAVEGFDYDRLNRLTNVRAIKAPAQPLHFAYDRIGNLTTKSDVGALTYGDPSRPHALTKSPLGTYRYDANGNMTERAGATMTYTAFDKLRSLTTSGATTVLEYDAQDARVLQTSADARARFVGDHYTRIERADRRGPLIEHRYRVRAGSTVVEVIRSGGIGKPVSGSVRYHHRDHLGSATATTDDAGAVTGRRTFAPFGGASDALGDAGDLGFAGHEAAGSATAGLINMKGRMYDPVIGRFTAADPFISPLHPSQGLNRYSYAMNNPLRYVDPNGYQVANIELRADGLSETTRSPKKSPKSSVFRPEPWAYNPHLGEWVPENTSNAVNRMFRYALAADSPRTNLVRSQLYLMVFNNPSSVAELVGQKRRTHRGYSAGAVLVRGLLAGQQSDFFFGAYTMHENPPIATSKFVSWLTSLPTRLQGRLVFHTLEAAIGPIAGADKKVYGKLELSLLLFKAGVEDKLQLNSAWSLEPEEGFPLFYHRLLDAVKEEAATPEALNELREGFRDALRENSGALLSPLCCDSPFD